ncbi:sensor histidine kinase [Hymenobacter sp. HDW8]|uniref:sensor histidine kinase n=1 Tax=Hymenobacter sp. HDW8 TaxID=2714932 RepID=UPI00140899DE|nr:histidine kinase [Hymenobacter sp. HDW8]QIL77592.1 sensor histidine kinase [Hymenobacter sp. HDW8]
MTYSPIATLPPARFSRGSVVAILAFYLVFAVFYAATIAYASQEFDPGAFPSYLRRVLLLDYPLKALWTLPVWWLFFRTPLDKAAWSTKLLVHLVAGPLWVTGWFVSYYALLGWLGESGISGNGRVWDMYIPALFYCVQFGLLHVARYTQQLRLQSQREQQLQVQAHQSEVSALKAQINPHFLFNTLNSISASVPPELETTRELIARLAHTFRFALEASRQEQLPLGDEISFLRSYLELEKSRFGERLSVAFQVDEALHTQLLPPMLIQPLVENAVRHGLAPSVAGGMVLIHVSRVSAGLRVEVADTGVGIKEVPSDLLMPSARVGLRNTHARLLALGSAGLKITQNAPHGMRVSFVLPLPAAAQLATIPAQKEAEPIKIPAKPTLQSTF